MRRQRNKLSWVTPAVRKQAQLVQPGRIGRCTHGPLTNIDSFCFGARDANYIIKLPGSASENCCPFRAVRWFRSGQPITPLQHEPTYWGRDRKVGSRTWYVELTLDRTWFPKDPAMWPQFTLRATAIKDKRGGRDQCGLYSQPYLDLPPDVEVDGRDRFDFTPCYDAAVDERADIPLACLYLPYAGACSMSSDGIVETAGLACVFYLQLREEGPEPPEQVADDRP